LSEMTRKDGSNQRDRGRNGNQKDPQAPWVVRRKGPLVLLMILVSNDKVA